MEGKKLPSGARRVKNKLVKNESDCIKLAEKKQRRLEKALATSAAICSELEKKKQKKKEEQQRLDEEGAAIAEAVALHVLLGEDSEHSCNINLRKGGKFNSCDFSCSCELLMCRRRAAFPHQDISKYCFEGAGWFSYIHRSGYKFSDWGNSDLTFSLGPFGRYNPTLCLDEGVWEATGFSAGLSVAQAVLSLQIADDAHGDELAFNQLF